MFALLLGALGIGIAATLLSSSNSKTAEEILNELLENLESFLDGKLKDEEKFIEKFNENYKEKRLQGRNSKIDSIYIYSSEGLNKIKKKIENENENYCKCEKLKSEIMKEIEAFKTNAKNLLFDEKKYLGKLKIFQDVKVDFLSKKKGNSIEKWKKNIKEKILNINLEVQIEKVRTRIVNIENEIELELQSEKYYNFYLENFFLGKIEKACSELKILNSENSLNSDINKLEKLKNEIPQKRKLKNEKFINLEKNKRANLFKTIGNHGLDSQQIEAAIKNEISNLVIAGAGSGKTTTIRGRIKYLIEALKIPKEEILTLAFNKKSATELKKSLKNDGYEIDTMTFHSFGMKLIKEVDGQDIKIFKNMEKKIDELYKKLTEDSPEYLSSIIAYFGFFLTEPKEIFDFKTSQEYEEYITEKNLKSLKGEFHRSYQEVLIANFLFRNNIDYQYESMYPLPEDYINEYSSFGKKNIYHPDFYLVDYNIYLEHFGINRKGEVPSFWGKNAKEEYWNGINWKRQLHKDLDTKLIETYSYEYTEETLFSGLKNKLLAENLELTQLSDKKTLEKIEENLEKEYSTFKKMINSFITYAKNNNIDLEELRKSILENDYSRNSVFLKLVIPLSQEYEDYLKETKQIDFSDMIIKATEYLQKNKVSRGYKHIIIDEFQDISITRFNLLKEIWMKNKGILFCVGDDWQSIYKFTGSNVNLFLEFEKYTGYCEQSKIETNYRYPKSIAELSSKFIMKNPIQITKNIKSFKPDSPKEKAYEIVYYNSNIKKMVQDKLMSLPKESNILLLIRNKKEIENIKDYNLKEAKDNILIFYKRCDLKINYQTVHSAKGLEADYVFLLSNSGGMTGFPNTREDDPVFKIIKNGLTSNYPFDEERRLYYVALTRAKEKLFLFVDIKNKSEFIQEIEKDFVRPYNCPKCGSNLEYKENGLTNCKNCDNSPKLDQIYTGERCICSDMRDKILRHHNNKYFLGCSDYPNCKETKEIFIYELNSQNLKKNQ
ncbi:MAG: UvrD-helicase domain-containing protein [Fusobacteriaceae bacterium]